MGQNRRVGHWTAAGRAEAANTAIFIGIPPWCGPPGSAPHLFSYKSPKLDYGAGAVTVVTDVGIVAGSTAHTFTFLRPKNFTTIAEAVLLNDTTIVMADNPGLYATTYKYPLPPGVSGVPGLVADNTPASGDYVMFQLDNGAWHTSLVSSLSSLTLTIATGTPNVAGSTAAVGRVLFFFAATGDKDPATGVIDPVFLPAVSATLNLSNPAGIVAALRPGDPLVLLSLNATAASSVSHLSGGYFKQ